MNSPSKKSNLRLLMAVGLIFASGIIGLSQTPKTTSATKAVAAPKKCLLWKAVSGSNVVYLLGSIHLASKAVYPLPKVMTDGFARSKVLVVEVDINKIDMASAAQYLASGRYSDGDTLWKHLSPETTAKVKKFIANQDMPEDFVSTLKPWLAGVMIPMIPMLKAGAVNDLGIDKHFLDLAEGKKKVEQVETADFQFKLLSSVPDNLADVYVNYSIGEISHAKQDDLKLEKLWMSGDATAIDEAMSVHPKELDPLMRSLLQDRNPHMADVAEKYLKGGGPCFFVVGAAHLVGKDGVVAILQKRGYSVTQMNAQ